MRFGKQSLGFNMNQTNKQMNCSTMADGVGKMLLRKYIYYRKLFLSYWLYVTVDQDSGVAPLKRH